MFLETEAKDHHGLLRDVDGDFDSSSSKIFIFPLYKITRWDCIYTYQKANGY